MLNIPRKFGFQVFERAFGAAFLGAGAGQFLAFAGAAPAGLSLEAHLREDGQRKRRLEHIIRLPDHVRS